MNDPTLERPEVAAYLAAVRSALADVPADERDELLADVEASLLESEGETLSRPPEAFAAELRDAAGLASPRQATPGALASLQMWLARDRVKEVLQLLRELAPIWWLARAYVAVVLLAAASNQGWPIGADRQYSEVSFETSVLALLAAGAISIWLGLRSRRPSLPYRRLRIAGNIVLALALLPVAVYSFDQVSIRGFGSEVVTAEPLPGLGNDGVPFRNIYPYSRDGRLLHDVFLYNDRGMPVEVFGAPDPARRVLVGRDGTPHLNSYPIRYYEPGTETVARPNLTPSILLPGEIVTPPLGVER